MAKQIETEVKNILNWLLQCTARGNNITKTWYRVSGDNLANWYAAMNFLKTFGVLDFEVVDNHNNTYTIRLIPADEYAELKYRYTVVNETKLKELCLKYNISIPTKSTSATGTVGIFESNPTLEIAMLRAFDETSPYIQKDAELIYKPKQGRLDLIVDDEIYQISLRGGQVTDIISVSASSDYIDTYVSKGLIEQEIGHTMSDPLTTIMKDSIFVNELSNFACIEPRAITIYREGRISIDELQRLRHKNHVKVVNR